jgi:hypothetical protein
VFKAKQAREQKATKKQGGVVARKYQRQNQNAKQEAIVLEVDMINHEESRRQKY